MFVLISGTAAFNVDGKTLHSLLQIPIAKKANEEMRDLDGDPLMRLQMALQGTKILVIDEMSMISPGFLYKVNRRLQQAFPENKTKPFGGISVLIMGGELYQIEATLLISNPFPLPLLLEYHDNILLNVLFPCF